MLILKTLSKLNKIKKGKAQNICRIVNAYTKRKNIEKFCHIVTVKPMYKKNI